MSNIYVDRHSRIIFYGNPAGVVKDKAAICDPMFKTGELCEFVSGQGLAESWQEGLYERLAAGVADAENEQCSVFLKSVRVYRLKPTSKVWATLATPGKALPEPERTEYEVMLDEEPVSNDLEQICERYSLTLSDVVELYCTDGSECYYLDRTCLRQVQF